ncbi:hypothetical protein BGP34_31145 [Bacillus mycoides]|nr:hypothetical protein BGP34_31145 [Bacillus mycoides]
MSILRKFNRNYSLFREQSGAIMEQYRQKMIKLFYKAETNFKATQKHVISGKVMFPLVVVALKKD